MTYKPICFKSGLINKFCTFKKIFGFQNRRLAVAEDPARVGPLELDGRRAAQEEGGGRGSSPAHDLGRDDVDHGNPRHGNGKLFQRFGLFILIEICGHNAEPINSEDRLTPMHPHFKND